MTSQAFRPDVRSSIVAIARSWTGTPYVHQASCRGGGSDCLGLVRGVWRELYGREPVEIPDYSADWGETGRSEFLWSAAERILEPVAPRRAQPGDVLLFRMKPNAVAKHLGILSSSGCAHRFIHAFSGHGVIESHLTEAWSRRLVAAFSFPESN